MHEPTPDGYRVSSDRSELDLNVIWGYLTRSYWATGVSRDVVRASLEGSLNFGLLHGTDQVGFARVVTDRATFAWLADVFVLEPHRGRGLGKFLIETVRAHPELQGLRRWMLGTADAHGLYERFGFARLAAPERFMEIRQQP